MSTERRWRFKVDWSKYQANTRIGLEHFFRTAQDVREFLAGAGRSPTRQALFHILYCGLLLAGQYKALDRRVTKILRELVVKEQQLQLTQRVDEKAAYALWAVLGGDCETVATMLDVPASVIQQMAAQRGWKLPRKSNLSRERALNRGLNYLVSHKLRSVVYKLIEGLHALRTDELYRLLMSGGASKHARLKITDFETLARTVVFLHKVTEETLTTFEADPRKKGVDHVSEAFLEHPSDAASERKSLAGHATGSEAFLEGSEEGKNFLPSPQTPEKGRSGDEPQEKEPKKAENNVPEAFLGSVVEKSVSEFFREALEDPGLVAENLRKIINQPVKDVSASVKEGEEEEFSNVVSPRKIDFRPGSVENSPLAHTVKVRGKEKPLPPARELSEIEPNIGAIPISAEILSQIGKSIEKKADQE